MEQDNWLNVEEIAAVLDEEVDLLEADVFIQPPENPLLSDEDSGEEDDADITHFSGNQLRGAAEMRAKRITAEGIVDVDIRTKQDVIDKLTTDSMVVNAIGGQSTSSNYIQATSPLSLSTSPNSQLGTMTKTAAAKKVSNRKKGKVEKKKQSELKKRATKNKKANQKRSWTATDIPNKAEREFERPSWLQKDFNPVEMFELFFDDDIVDYIVECTNSYAMQSGNQTFQITAKDIRLFIAILFLSGYCSVPRKRMYWETSEDTHHAMVSKAISRNKFEDILRYFHVSDNAKLDPSDKFTKVRPLWNMLNERWLQAYHGDVNLSIDESMVPYYGKHSAKQHIHGKPIRFGYKVWSMCSRLGYLIQAEPYQGKTTGNTNPELGVGGSVVVDLLSDMPQDKTYSVCIDNFFTSLKLLDHLSSLGHDVTGTIRANRIENAPLKEVKEVKKQPRGSFHQLTEGKTGITLVRYNDNNVVTVASTCSGVLPMGIARRWCRVTKRKINIQQPACVVRYNTYMGGVDQLDQNVSTYRIGIRNKKWYWPLVSYLLNATMNNAWQLYRLTPKGKEEPKYLLAFVRYLVVTYLRKYTTDRPRASRPSISGKKRVLDSVRLSRNRLHILETNPTQVRCGLCKKNTWKLCKMCRVGCHIKCFENFHS